MPTIGDQEHKLMSKIYAEMVAMLNSNSVTDMLGWMAARGSCVSLEWGEDDNHWTCSWISSGRRFTAVRKEIRDAIRDVIGQVRTDYLEKMTE